MSTTNGAIAVADRPAGLVDAAEWTRERIQLLKEIYAKDTSDAEFELAISIAKRTGLSPEARQIWFRKQWDSRSRKEVLLAIVAIDGFRLIAERSGKYEGQLGPWWCGPDGDWRDVWLDLDKPPAAAKVGVIKSGFREPIYSVATFRSYAQTKDGRPIAQWSSMPDVMLAKCAESQALRRAFPQELSGVYTSDEMGQAENGAPPQEPTARPQPRQQQAPPQQARPARPAAPAPVPDEDVIDLDVPPPVRGRGEASPLISDQQMRRMFASANERFGADGDHVLKVLAATNYGAASRKDLTQVDADNLIKYLERTHPDEVRAFVASVRSEGVAAGQQAMAIAAEPAGDEAALINFRERAEATLEWAPLFDEAGTSVAHWVELMRAAGSLAQLDAVTKQIRERGVADALIGQIAAKRRGELRTRVEGFAR